jgi:hypothetical protein
VVFLAEVLAGRLQVHQERDVVTDFLPVVGVEFDADMARDGVEMDQRIGRAADCGVDDENSIQHSIRRLAPVGGLREDEQLTTLQRSALRSKLKTDMQSTRLRHE